MKKKVTVAAKEICVDVAAKSVHGKHDIFILKGDYKHFNKASLDSQHVFTLDSAEFG